MVVWKPVNYTGKVTHNKIHTGLIVMPASESSVADTMPAFGCQSTILQTWVKVIENVLLLSLLNTWVTVVETGQSTG